MRQYTKIKNEIEEPKLVAVICNKCGKEIQLKYRMAPELDEEMKACLTEISIFTAKKTWGYGSNHDMEQHQFDLCESCYDDWINSFAIPVSIEEYNI